MSVGDFFWSLLVIYLILYFILFYIFYFVILFRVLGDLLGDRETSGLADAAWIMFLIFVPFLALFVYLIVRGRGMAERTIAHARASEAAEQDYIRRTGVTADDPTATIAKAHELLNSGAITQSEFDTLKAKVLA